MISIPIQPKFDPEYNSMTSLMAFDTRIAGKKSLITGITVGQIDKITHDFRVSEVGEKIIKRMVEYHASEFPEIAIPSMVVIDVRDKNPQASIKKVFENAKTGDLLLFICEDSAIYDAAFPALKAKFN